MNYIADVEGFVYYGELLGRVRDKRRLIVRDRLVIACLNSPQTEIDVDAIRTSKKDFKSDTALGKQGDFSRIAMIDETSRHCSIRQRTKRRTAAVAEGRGWAEERGPTWY
jgi:hypothetical protein